MVVEGYTTSWPATSRRHHRHRTCGTAFAGDHIKILRRLLMDNAASEVVFTFDGDAAAEGRPARLRGRQKFAAETSIAITPGGMDPCELRWPRATPPWPARRDPHPLFAFAIRQVVARHNLDTARAAPPLEAAAPIVANIKNGAIQHEYAVQLAGMLGILDTQFVVRRVGQLARWPATAPAPRRPHGAAPGPAAAGPAAAGRRARRSTSAAPPPDRARAAQARPPAPRAGGARFDAYGEDEFTAQPYVAVRRAISRPAASATPPTAICPGPRGRPDDTSALVTELAVEAIRSKNVDEAYAGVQLVQVRLRPSSAASRTSRPPWSAWAPRRTPPSWRRAERTVGPGAVRRALKDRGAAALYPRAGRRTTPGKRITPAAPVSPVTSGLRK
nr:hypothetical protein [Streptomyces cinnamoneus]